MVWGKGKALKKQLWTPRPTSITKALLLFVLYIGLPHTFLFLKDALDFRNVFGKHQSERPLGYGGR
jgi:hypothetical protein